MIYCLYRENGQLSPRHARIKAFSSSVRKKKKCTQLTDTLEHLREEEILNETRGLETEGKENKERQNREICRQISEAFFYVELKNLASSSRVTLTCLMFFLIQERGLFTCPVVNDSGQKHHFSSIFMDSPHRLLSTN